jgi:hypothetical protein
MSKDLWFGDDEQSMHSNRKKLRQFLEHKFRRDADAQKIIRRLLKSKADEQAEVQQVVS